MDGTLRAEVTGVDNDQFHVDGIRLGAVNGIDTGTRATNFFDAFESLKETYIGAADEGLMGSGFKSDGVSNIEHWNSQLFEHQPGRWLVQSPTT